MYNPYGDEEDDFLEEFTMGFFVFMSIVIGGLFLVTQNKLFMVLYLLNLATMYYVLRKYYND